MINKKTLFIGALTALTISMGAAANKPIYKWKDSQGNIKYTQSKPPRGTDFETIYHRQSNQQQTSDANDELVAEQKKRENANKSIRQKNCDVARKNHSTLKNEQSVYIQEGDERRLLTAEEKQERLEQAEENIKSFCD